MKALPTGGLEFKVKDLGCLAPRCLPFRPSDVTVLPLLSAVTAASMVTVLNVAANKAVTFLVHYVRINKQKRKMPFWVIL